MGIVARLGPCFALVAALPLPVAAQMVVDQQQTQDASDQFFGTRSGQSFTPTLSAIDFATFNFEGVGTAYVDLYAGAGFGGTVIGSSQVVALTSNAAFSPYTFSFAAPVELTPGSVYTLRIEGTGSSTLAGTGYIYLAASTNAYAGGDRYNTSGASSANDMYFVEGVSSVPEPACWSLMILGIGTAGGLFRRRRAASTVSTAA